MNEFDALWAYALTINDGDWLVLANLDALLEDVKLQLLDEHPDNENIYAIKKIKMNKEVYENLPEFEGF